MYNDTEIRDTLNAIDKAVSGKEIRTVLKLSRQARKYRNVIKGHHLLEIVSQLGIEFDHSVFKNSPSFDAGYSGNFDIGKNIQTRFPRVLELEAFIRSLIILFLWREKNYALCLANVNELLGRIDSANRRTLDAYGALMFYFYLRLHEKNGSDLEQRGTLL